MLDSSSSFTKLWTMQAGSPIHREWKTGADWKQENGTGVVHSPCALDELVILIVVGSNLFS